MCGSDDGASVFARTAALGASACELLLINLFVGRRLVLHTNRSTNDEGRRWETSH